MKEAIKTKERGTRERGNIQALCIQTEPTPYGGSSSETSKENGVQAWEGWRDDVGTRSAGVACMVSVDLYQTSIDYEAAEHPCVIIYIC